MARYTFGGSADDAVWSTSVAGSLFSGVGATVAMYSAQSGGTQYTDLLVGGSPATTVTAGAGGALPIFQGPDGITSMWADAGAGFRTRLDSPSNYLQIAQGPVEVSAHQYGIRPSSSSSTNNAGLAQLAIDYPGAVLISFPEVGTYNFSAPLPDRSNLRLKGVGHAVGGTLLQWIAGSMLAPSSGSVITGLHFSDLRLNSSASAHLIELGSSVGITYTTFERILWGSPANGVSFMHGSGFTNCFGIRFRDCLLHRASTATVSAIDLKCGSSGLSNIWFDDCELNSQGATGTPFIRIESTAVSSYAANIALRNIVGEQNAGGLLHGFGVNGVTIENVWDADLTTYADSLFKFGSGSGGAQPYGVHVENSGTAGVATFTSGDHVTITGGGGHYVGRVMNSNNSDGKVTITSAPDTVRRHVAGLIEGLTTLTASTSLGVTHRTVISNGTSVTQTLPAAASTPVGREYVIKNINATSCTVATAGGNIDGAATKSLAQFASAHVVNDGTNWYTF